jgi:hypothetical protein
VILGLFDRKSVDVKNRSGQYGIGFALRSCLEKAVECAGTAVSEHPTNGGRGFLRSYYA